MLAGIVFGFGTTFTNAVGEDVPLANFALVDTVNDARMASAALIIKGATLVTHEGLWIDAAVESDADGGGGGDT